MPLRQEAEEKVTWGPRSRSPKNSELYKTHLPNGRKYIGFTWGYIFHPETSAVTIITGTCIKTGWCLLAHLVGWLRCQTFPGLIIPFPRSRAMKKVEVPEMKRKKVLWNMYLGPWELRDGSAVPMPTVCV